MSPMTRIMSPITRIMSPMTRMIAQAAGAPEHKGADGALSQAAHVLGSFEDDSVASGMQHTRQSHAAYATVSCSICSSPSAALVLVCILHACVSYMCVPLHVYPLHVCKGQMNPCMRASLSLLLVLCVSFVGASLHLLCMHLCILRLCLLHLCQRA